MKSKCLCICEIRISLFCYAYSVPQWNCYKITWTSGIKCCNLGTNCSGLFLVTGHFWCCVLNSNTLLLITKLYRCTLASVFTVSVFISFGFCVFDIHSNHVIFISIIGSSMPLVFIFFLKFIRIIIMNIILCKFTLHRYLLLVSVLLKKTFEKSFIEFFSFEICVYWFIRCEFIGCQNFQKKILSLPKWSQRMLKRKFAFSYHFTDEARILRTNVLVICSSELCIWELRVVTTWLTLNLPF